MLFKIFLLIFSLLKCAQCSWDEDCPYLKTHPNLLSLQTLNGKVKGECWNIDIHYSETRTTTTQVLKWMSIPYAEAPINENRFKKPKPVKPWSTEIDGTIEPKYCLQISDESIENNSEDCLYLNIHVQADTYLNRNKELKPILVYIHGGSFVVGDGAGYDASNIVAMKDIIVVTINYRLNALGFLGLEDTEATGNQALLDQTLALKWIHENAFTFGGDNSKVTINGQSAGAWSVGYLLFYNKSWGYFRNAIMQSGGPTGKRIKNLRILNNILFERI